MADNRIVLGIVGAGIMGERLLGAALSQAGESIRVAGIWDPSPDAMARIAAAFPDVPWLGDAAAAIAACDCLYVASPPASHLGYARMALSAGKTVFCEKPLAVDLADARAFVAEAGSRGAVNFPFASSPAVATLQRWIAEGVIGTPRRIAIEVAFATWPRSWQADAAGWLDARAQGGFSREVVSHFLFLSRRLGGPLAGLKASADFPEAGRSERRIAATLTAGNLPVTLSGTVGITTKDDHNIWMIEGGAGAVRLCDWSVAERRMPDGSWQRDPDALPNEKARPLVLKRQLEGVARMTRGEPFNLATLAEALDVQEVVEAVLASPASA
ncbi:MAG: Gfo/Idh/MocA family oxidoreductase [Phreatobacter sp.]|uniref:Gfo/Idh/MocA family protein n=1 Tax=Phreatobacter sp. TaxID=1966341 RepID=UPI001A4796CA|nr:Gfo/Idh/MocA family oxidoreductase [Phreatobacter sp.]MBL8568057.1 Gfo/Idh/MocA family oxidoreductase [Phreatobacter sp.]